MSYFTREERKALGMFFLKISAVPFILIAGTMFFLGFYISDVMKGKTMDAYERRLASTIEAAENAKKEALLSAEAIRALNAEGLLESDKLAKKLASILVKDQMLLKKIDKNYSSLETDVIDTSEKIDFTKKEFNQKIRGLQRSLAELETTVADLKVITAENAKNIADSESPDEP